MAWTDERVELLKKLWAEGLSAAQIANKMGGVTRNAVIGKVHRLGLSGRATPAKPQRGCSAPSERSSASAAPRAPRAEVQSVIPEPEFTAPLIMEDGDRSTVATIKNNMCKWPVGDPAKDDFHFCGQPTLITRILPFSRPKDGPNAASRAVAPSCPPKSAASPGRTPPGDLRRRPNSGRRL
jgi:GcrA cell cycle regulator